MSNNRMLKRKKVSRNLARIRVALGSDTFYKQCYGIYPESCCATGNFFITYKFFTVEK